MLIHLAMVVATFCALVNGTDGSKSKIAGGIAANISKHPYIVSIQNDGYHYCGGSIISKSIVITAAHCIPSELDNLNILAGTSYANNQPHAHASIHRVEAVLVHKKYRDVLTFSGWKFPVKDIALIKIRTPLVFGKRIAAISMFNAGEEIPPGSIATACGWGRVPEKKRPIFSGGADLKQLRSVQIPIVPRTVCDREYRRMNLIHVKPGEICARGNGKDTCQGDSGGPLVVAGRLAGLVSWGYDCEEQGLPPGIYTEVAFFRNWIDKNVKRLENDNKRSNHFSVFDEQRRF